MKELQGELFASDPRLRKATQLILETLADYQHKLRETAPPDPARAIAYEKMLEDFGEMRGGPLFFPYLGSGIGKGALVELADGSVKYDCIAGIGVHYLGHSHPALVEACIQAALEDTVMQGNLQQNPDSIAFMELMLELARKNDAALSHCFLTTSGAMANENALKIIFQKKSPARRLIAFEGCFAGRSLALTRVTDKAAYRDGLPDVLQTDYLPFLDPEHAQESLERALQRLDECLKRYPGEYAALMFEPIQGEAGFRPGSHEFFLPIFEMAKKAGLLIFADEIQTFGRTYEPFAFQMFALDEYIDIVTVGKLTQICATLFSDVLRPRPGLISQTFTGASASIRAGRAILKELSENNYFGKEGKIALLNEQFEKNIVAIMARKPGLIRGPFGIGAMAAFEVYDASLEKTRDYVRRLYEAGVISFFAGNKPARVRFLLPVGALSIYDLDKVCSIVERCLGGAEPMPKGELLR